MPVRYIAARWNLVWVPELVFITFSGLSLWNGKKITQFISIMMGLHDNMTKVHGNCQMWNSEKKHQSCLVFHCIILAWNYGKLTEIKKTTNN